MFSDKADGLQDHSGHIVTNFHVIRGASSVQVTLDGGNEYVGKVIGQDEDKDVAVLYIEDKTVRCCCCSCGLMHVVVCMHVS